MRRFSNKRAALHRMLVALAVLLGVLTGVVVAACGSSNHSEAHHPVRTATVHQLTATTADAPRGVASVSVGAPLAVRAVQPGFLGLSLEYYSVTQNAGRDPHALNPLFLALVRGLNPGQDPVLRFGGDSTDWAWLPTPGVRRVAGDKDVITPKLLGVMAAVTRSLDARLILGINLEADSPALAAHLSRTLVNAVGPSHVEALELGNEPELYDVLGWYANRFDKAVFGRTPGFDLGSYTRDFDSIARALPDVPLAGPASGSAEWDAGIAGFVRAARGLGMVTVHAYPLETCGTAPGLASYPTIAKLLSPGSTLGLAQALEPAARAAGAAGKLIRVDETNSVSCYGLAGVSNTFAAALWSVELAFQFAREGIDGINLTTLPEAAYRLWTLRHGSADVSPQYYGLLDFADAVPPGSKLLSTPDDGANPQVFAVRTPSGQTHVVIVNTGAARPLAVHVPDTAGATATATYLEAPALSATGGVSLAGQSFGRATADGDLTRTGKLRGAETGTAVEPVDGAYVTDLPADSVTTLSVRSGLG